MMNTLQWYKGHKHINSCSIDNDNNSTNNNNDNNSTSNNNIK